MKKTATVLFSGTLLLALTGLNSANAAPDAAAAQTLMDSNKCIKCHDVKKTKSGPSLEKIAAKYKGKVEGEDKVIKNITTGPTVKLDDGTEEEHKVIKTRDPAQLKNLAQWILSH